MNKLVSLLFAVISVFWGSAHALPVVYEASLLGSAEAPPNASPGTGLAKLSYDASAHTLLIDVSFANLIGTTTSAHIHCCTALPETGTSGVATTTPSLPGFPSGVVNGTYNQTFDLTNSASFNASFIAATGGTVGGAEAALAAGLDAGTAYFNIHTEAFPGGEIRGFLVPVPEPAQLSLLLIGLGLTGLLANRRKKSL